MPFDTIRLLPLLAAGVSFMVLGALWYGPLFAKPWMSLVGITMEEATANAKPGMYVWAFVAALVASYVLDVFISATFLTTLAGGATVGLCAAIGFVATSFATNYIFSQRPFRLYLIDAGYQVVALTVAGAILGAT